MAILDEGISQGKASSMDFVGSIIGATVTAGVAKITLTATPATVEIFDEGATQGDASGINFIGGTIGTTVTAGVASVTVTPEAQTVEIQDGGVSKGTASGINFIGGTIEAAVVAGVASVTVTPEAQTVKIFEESGSLGNVSGINFVGSMITATSTNGIAGIVVTPNTYEHVITVAKSGGDFTSIKSAIDSITGNSITSRWIVRVAPGIYAENPITTKAYVDVESIGGSLVTAITANTVGSPLITGSGFNTISGFTLSGTTGASLILLSVVTITLINDIQMYNALTGLELTAGGVAADGLTVINIPATTVGTFIDITGTGNASFRNLDTSTSAIITTEVNVSGVSAICAIHGAFLRSTATTGLKVNAGHLTITDINISNATTAIDMDNDCHIDGNIVYIDDTCTIHINSNDTTSTVHMACGEMNREKFVGPVGYQAETISFRDTNDSHHVIYAEQSIGRPEYGRQFITGEGAPYTQHMVVLTTDNNADSTHDGGNFIDVSTEAASPSGSTFSFQGITANHTILISTSRESATDDLRIQSLRFLQTTAAVEISAKSFVFEKWDGADWVIMQVMAHEATDLYRYANSVFLRASSSEVIVVRPLATWAKKTINGANHYWMRVRIATTVTTAPVFERMLLEHSNSRFNAQGIQIFNGLSKFKATIAVGGNIFGESGGVAGGNIAVGSGGLPTGWDHAIKNSIMNQDADAIYFQSDILRGFCTSCPVTILVTLVARDNITAVSAASFITSFLPMEVAGILTANPNGDPTPVARTLALTETLTAKVAQYDTQAVIADATAYNKFQEINFGDFDISDYYEGDSFSVRIEMDYDGGNNQAFAIWSVAVTGYKWTHGARLMV